MFGLFQKKNEDDHNQKLKEKVKGRKNSNPVSQTSGNNRNSSQQNAARHSQSSPQANASGNQNYPNPQFVNQNQNNSEFSEQEMQEMQKQIASNPALHSLKPENFNPTSSLPEFSTNFTSQSVPQISQKMAVQAQNQAGLNAPNPQDLPPQENPNFSPKSDWPEDFQGQYPEDGSNDSNSSNSNNSNLQISDDEKEILVFLNTLVAAMTGFSILDIKEKARNEVVSKCIDIFSSYILNYIDIKFGQKESLRLKSGQMYEDMNIFARFQELGPMFDEAYQSFLENLKENWQNSNDQDGEEFLSPFGNNFNQEVEMNYNSNPQDFNNQANYQPTSPTGQNQYQPNLETQR